MLNIACKRTSAANLIIYFVLPPCMTTNCAYKTRVYKRFCYRAFLIYFKLLYRIMSLIFFNFIL